MPFVNVRTARGLLTAEQKCRLHEELTAVLVRVEGGGDPDFRRYVTVLLEEHDADSWSVSGQQLTETVVSDLARTASRGNGPQADHSKIEAGTSVPRTQELEK